MFDNGRSEYSDKADAGCMLNNNTLCAFSSRFVMTEVKVAPIHDDTQSWEEYPMVSVVLYSGRLTVYHANRKPILSSKVMFIFILCLLMSLEIMWRDAT